MKQNEEVKTFFVVRLWRTAGGVPTTVEIQDSVTGIMYEVPHSYCTKKLEQGVLSFF